MDRDFIRQLQRYSRRLTTSGKSNFLINIKGIQILAVKKYKFYEVDIMYRYITLKRILVKEDEIFDFLRYIKE